MDDNKNQSRESHAVGTENTLREKSDWLSKRIEDSIKRVESKSNKFKKTSSLIKIATIIFAGLITIFLGFKNQCYEETFKMIAFILGAVITVLNGLEPFFNFRLFWIEHEEAEYKFRRLRDEYGFYLSGLNDNDLKHEELSKYEKKFQEIWDNLSMKWLSYRRSNNKENN